MNSNFRKNKHTKSKFHSRSNNGNKKSKKYTKTKRKNYNNDKPVQAEMETKRMKFVSESESDEEIETENPIQQLLETFQCDVNNRKINAIESEDEDEDEEEIDNDNVIKNEDGDGDNDDISDTVETETESELDPETENVPELTLPIENDPFVKHLTYDLSDDLLESLQQQQQRKEVECLEWSALGKLIVTIPKCNEKPEKQSTRALISDQKPNAPLGQIPVKNTKPINLNSVYIKAQIQEHIRNANKALNAEDENCYLTEFQSELFTILNNYQDFYYTDRTFENGEELRFVYVLHAINHVLKTRTKILHHNARLLQKDDVPEEFRDQGLARPKVLILVPFRDAALKIVQILIDILVPADKGQVINKNRFFDEFTGSEILMPKKNPKPEDYERIFAGNCDDTFKIGIQVTKKSLKLYADFYSCDIIIASPLGLRLVIGAEGESERDYDFLTSIELLIMDQTDLFLMQNWDHILQILDHMHLQPRASHGTDFTRIRTWALNGWTKYYRQTLIFASRPLPELNAIFNRKCCNYSGWIKTNNPVTFGTIANVCVQVPHIYRRFETNSVPDAIDSRFRFFKEKILPQYRDAIMKQCLIYVPNYFDYVRVRNHLKREDISFVQICEYSKEGKVARARDMFFHGQVQFLLYSERFHYFRRIRIKGVRHIVFYQPPTFAHFYPELCNFMQEANQNEKCGSISNMTVTVMYSKYDAHQVAGILGTERLTNIASATSSVHMFTSSD